MLFAAARQKHMWTNPGHWLRHLFIALLVSIGGHGANAESTNRDEQKDLPAHTPVIAPNWILPDMHGNPVSLYELAESGKTTVMFFWATWCGSCRTLLPELSKLHKQKGKKSVHIILMNAWEDDDPLKFLAEQQLGLPVILQTEMVAQRYNITTAPGMVVVTPDKRITYIHQPREANDKIVGSLRSLMLAK